MKDWSLLHDHVSKILKAKLPPYLTYHNPDHTMYVMDMAEKIAREEQVSESDILLIKTAALYHDLGFIKGSGAHEAESERIAAAELPGFGYTQAEIDIIIGMIEATSIPQKPKTKLEKILADADLEYLGTDNFELIGDGLLQELRHDNPGLTREKWDAIQIDFLQKHYYHTNYCILNRKPKKDINLSQLIKKTRNDL
jgi:predicted metal-dependent HD superfamily phosphohydrolase